ncbi:MAG: hypothetical protein IJK59_06795 [Firmicutes bacterium]|nr:hypothetical protein [Bacillota bacterium]
MTAMICFFGGDSQTGTTLLAEAVTMSLAAKGAKALLILASGEQDEGFFPGTSAGLGSLLRLQRPAKDDVKACIVRSPGLDYIPGRTDMFKKQFHDPDLIGMIRPLVERDYDVIICDGGHDATTPLPISCLTASDRRFYVLTPGPKCAARFSETWQIVIKALGLDLDEDRIVLNRASSSLSGYSLSDLTSAFGLQGFSVPEYPDSLACEFSGSCPYGKDGPYTRAADLIASDILKFAEKGGQR